jgi:hypothetical protein
MCCPKYATENFMTPITLMGKRKQCNCINVNKSKNMSDFPTLRIRNRIRIYIGIKNGKTGPDTDDPQHWKRFTVRLIKNTGFLYLEATNK